MSIPLCCALEVRAAAAVSRPGHAIGGMDMLEEECRGNVYANVESDGYLASPDVTLNNAALQNNQRTRY